MDSKGDIVVVQLSVPAPVIVILRSEDGFEDDCNNAEYNDEDDERNDVCHRMSFLFPVTFQILVHRLVYNLTQRHILLDSEVLHPKMNVPVDEKVAMYRLV